MKLSEIAKFRLVSQQIIPATIKSAVEMVARFGAIQAQEYAQAKWSLGLRLAHLKDNDISKDFTGGNILRTHLLRPTWHFVVAKDIRWMLMLTSPAVHAANSYMYRKLELTNAIFNRCNDILIKTLEGHKQLTRDAINKEFIRNKIEAKGQRLSYIMMQAELDGIICSGARHGKQFTYALLEERVPEFKSINRAEALAELTRRYFTSRGPATAKDFSTWSGLTITECKKGIGMVKSYFGREALANEEYFFPLSLSLPKNQSQKIYLLPVYDEYIMGYKDRSAIMIFRNKRKTAPLFRYDNTIIWNGQITGTWKRSIKTKCIDVEYDFFENPGKKQFSSFVKSLHRFQEFNHLRVKCKGIPGARHRFD